MPPELKISGNVVDEQTGRPIETFRVTPGTIRRGGSRPHSWTRHETVKGQAGRYEIRIDHERDAHLLRVEADGYLPTVSREVHSDEGPVTLDFRLQPGGDVRGLVLATDGSPEVNANVILGTIDDRPYIRANGESSSRRGFSKRTDERGRFQFGSHEADYTVFVFAKSGFAHVPKSKFDQDSGKPLKIRVKPWARIEGVVRTADQKPDRSAQVKFEFTGAMGGQSFFGEHCYFDYHTKTNSDGKFVFDRVPPDTEVTVYRTVPIRHGRMTTIGRGASAAFELAQGQTRQIMLGMDGRRVTGRVVVDADVEADWQYVLGSFQTLDKSTKEEITYQSPASFQIQKNGSFQIDGVSPGRYRLFIRAEQLRENVYEHGETIGDFSRTITIPEAARPAHNNEAFDLGTFTIYPSSRNESASNRKSRMSDVLRSAGDRRKPAIDGAKAFRLELSIVDRNGKPVSGANVKAWYGAKEGLQIHSKQTAETGIVRFEDVPHHGSWIFAGADGFRSHSGYFDATTAKPRLVLIRNQEAVDEPIVPRTSLGHDKRTSRLALLALRKLARAIMLGHDENTKFQVERLLAQYDPQFAIELHEDNTIDFASFTQNPTHFGNWHNAVLRSFAARRLMQSDPSSALAVIETIPDFGMRAFAYSTAVEELLSGRHTRQMDSTAKKTLARDWLFKARQAAGKAEESHKRAEYLSRVGEQWLKLGDRGTALEVFQEAVVQANIPSDEERADYSSAYTAWQMAPVDLPAALKLVSGRTDAQGWTMEKMQDLAKRMQKDTNSEQLEDLREQVKAIQSADRALGNIAHRVAATHPAECEKLLGRLGPLHDMYAVRACYRMATVDPRRARKLADRIKDPIHRGHALGAIAHALAEHDLSGAKKMLRDAFTQLETAEVPSEPRPFTALKVAVALLPTVERIDVALLREYLSKTLSLRDSTTSNSVCRGPVCEFGRTGPDKTLRLADPLLGATFARYDRDIAQRLTFAPGDETLDLSFDDAPYFLLGASLMLNPTATVAAVVRMPQESAYQQRVKLAAWQQILPLLDKGDNERWEWLMDEQFQVWRIDKFDL
jgi:hypothetical protein